MIHCGMRALAFATPDSQKLSILSIYYRPSASTFTYNVFLPARLTPMNNNLDPKALLPLGPDEWKRVFFSFWPYYYADLAGMKQSFFKPLGKTDTHIFAAWKTCRDEANWPLVMICPQTKQAWVLKQSAPINNSGRAFGTDELRAFLDIH